MNENENKYLSLKAAAGLYGYTRDHLGLMIRKGKLRGVKLGSYYVTTSDWMTHYLKHYADPSHPATAGKFSNKFLSQVFAAKDPAVARHSSVKKAKNKILQELLPSLREITLAERESSALPALRHAISNNPYVILPIRKMEESERESILGKISERS